MDKTYEILFTWIHLSDIHFGHGPASHRWDQQLVLRALSDDLARLNDRGIPKPDVVLISGDIAFSGAKGEYTGAAAWLEQVAVTTDISPSDILTVPGNHDVQRDIDRADRNVLRLVERLRTGDESLDDALANEPDRRLLEARFTNYLEFVEAFLQRNHDANSSLSGLYWRCQRTAPLGLVIRFVGLNTAILSADDHDRGKLRVGKEQLAVGLVPPQVTPGEVTVVLSHHPLNWLADCEEVSRWLRARAHVHLSGHVHEAESERLRRGGGTDVVYVVAGAAHGDPGTLIGHSYSIGSIVASSDSQLQLRLWPRSWSHVNKDFRINVDQIPEGSVFVDHELRLRLPSAVAELTPAPSGQRLATDTPTGVGSEVSGDVTAPGSQLTPSNVIAPPTSYHQEYPPLVTAFVGREDELRVLDERVPVIAIVGIGGQGKSALAASYLQTSVAAGRYEFWDWRDCREEANKIHAQLIAIIERLTQGAIRGPQLVGANDESLARLFFDVLDERRALFVFDNIDQYVDLETAQPIGLLQILIRSALKRPHRARFLITCRPQLQYYEDGFLQLPLPGLSLDETRTLFRLRGVKIHSERVNDGILVAHQLTRGHALWLNLIATQVARAAATLEALVEDLRRSTSTHLPNAMLRSIWRMLTEKQKSVLRCLAETLRPESEERLAEYVTTFLNWNQYTKAVKTLKMLNLVVVKPVPGGRDGLELHPLIREFVRTEYSRKEREKFIAIICKVFDRVIMVFKPQLDRVPSYGILEHWTLRAELAMNRGNYKEALELLHDVAWALVGSGYVEEFVRVATRLSAELDWTEAVIENYDRFDWMVKEVTEQLSYLGRYREADELADRYEQVIIGKSARYIHLCDIRCFSYWHRGDYEKAKEWGKRGVELKRTGDVDTQFDCSHNLALAQRDSGEIEPALKYFLKDQKVEELLQANEEDEERPSHVFGNVGRCLWFLGDVGNAVRCLKRSARMLDRETGGLNLVNRGWAALWLGEILESRGRLDLAYCFFKRAEAKWRSASPINAQIAGDRVKALVSAHKEARAFVSWAEVKIEEKCKEWLDRANNGETAR